MKEDNVLPVHMPCLRKMSIPFYFLYHYLAKKCMHFAYLFPIFTCNFWAFLSTLKKTNGVSEILRKW